VLIVAIGISFVAFNFFAAEKPTAGLVALLGGSGVAAWRWIINHARRSSGGRNSRPCCLTALWLLAWSWSSAWLCLCACTISQANPLVSGMMKPRRFAGPADASKNLVIGPFLRSHQCNRPYLLALYVLALVG
jgi:hypothetical protein